MRLWSSGGRVLRSWRSWVAIAAGVWSLVVTVVGLLWTIDVVASPFGVSDSRAGEVGSYLDRLQPSQTGLVAVMVGLVGILTSLALWRFPGHRWPALPALCLSLVLILVVPDVRVIQNFAYLFIGYTGLWDGGLAAMVVSMAGGFGFGLAAAARLANGQGARHSLRVPRWGVAATYAAVVLALPYPIVRIAWGLGIPLGVPANYLDGWGWTERLGVIFVLGGLPIAGAILTVGLIRPWGEVFPRWILGLRGRRVPIWVAVVPGLVAAALLTQMGLRITPGAVASLSTMSWDGWGAELPGLFPLPWGIALSGAVYAYAVRRLRHDAASRCVDRPYGMSHAEREGHT